MKSPRLQLYITKTKPLSSIVGRVIVLSFVAIMLAGGCRDGMRNTAVQVVVSCDLIEVWCRQITPEELRIHSLVHGKPKERVRIYTMRDALALSQAKMYISMGYGVDDGVTRLLENHVSNNTQWLDLEEWEQSQIHDVMLKEEGRETRYPWLDLIWTQDAIREISVRLKEIFPSHAKAFEERTQAYLLRLHERYVYWDKRFEEAAKGREMRVSVRFRPWVDRFQLPHVEWIADEAHDERMGEKSNDAALRNGIAFVLVEDGERNESSETVRAMNPWIDVNDPDRDTFIEIINHVGETFLVGYGVENGTNRTAPTGDMDR